MSVRGLVGVLALGIVAGCQKGEPASPEPAPEAAAQVAVPAAASPGPETTVQRFLTALFQGDMDAATSLLTAKALEASRRADLELTAPGSSGATFEVTETAILEEDPNQAHVWTVVRDSVDGQQQAYDIVWLLRKEEQKWLVYGMATTLFEDRVPLLLDFEKPEDVIAKRKWAQEEHQRRLQQAAAQPADAPTQR